MAKLRYTKMIWKIALVLIAVLLGIIVVFIVKEILSKRNLKFYSDQGVITDYVPIIGSLELVHSPPVPGLNPFKEFLDYFAKHEKNPHSMVATNIFDSTEAVILLTDIDAIGEFLLLENECYRRMPGIAVETDDMLFFHNGEQALRDKARFAEFFRHKNILGMV